MTHASFGSPFRFCVTRGSLLLAGLWLAVPAGAAPEITGASLSPNPVNVTTGAQTVRYDAAAAPLPAGIQGDLLVQNTGTVDAAGPVITAISTTPASAKVTNAPQDIRIDVALQDSVAGLASAAIFLYSPTGTFSIDNVSLYYAFFPPFETIPVLTAATLTLPRCGASGKYRWVVKATDGAHQVSEYGGPNGSAFPGGFSGILTVQHDGTVDTSAPTLVSLVVNPPTRLVASLPSNVTFTVKATDEGGVDSACALLASPDGQSYDLFPMIRSNITLARTWVDSFFSATSSYPAK